jgi:hypothetical protein
MFVLKIQGQISLGRALKDNVCKVTAVMVIHLRAIFDMARLASSINVRVSNDKECYVNACNGIERMGNACWKRNAMARHHRARHLRKILIG